MKLTSQDTSRLTSILSTCAIGGIESVIIEEGRVRGVNDDKTCVIISNFEVPNFPQRIGLTRLSSLRQRLDLFANNPATVIDAKESDRGDISSIDISAGKNKVQFRCTSATLIKAPKSINDTAVARVFVKKDEMKMILNAIKVMGSKKVLLAIKKDRTVSFTLADATNDGFDSTLETPVEYLSEETMNSVVHYYAADIFAAVMRNDSDTTSFDVGAVGTINVSVNGHAITLLPQINEDGED